MGEEKTLSKEADAICAKVSLRLGKSVDKPKFFLLRYKMCKFFLKKVRKIVPRMHE